MAKFVVLIKFTEKGITHVDRSPERAEAFRATARKHGVTVDTLLWTTGPHDGVVILDAADEHAATGLVLGLARTGNVSTCTMRGFDAEEFKGVLGKMT